MKNLFKGSSPYNLSANQHGFTLIEMMIAMGITLLVMSGVYEVFTSQQKAYTTQERVAEMQQNVRVAMDMMSRNIRMAGYDPTESGIFGITNSTAYADSNSATLALTDSDKIYLTIDDDDDGTIDSNANERVAYQLSGGNLQVDDNGTWRDIAENITALSFTYTYADGQTSDTEGLPDNAVGDDTDDFDDIRLIEISITATTNKGVTDRTRLLTANVCPRNVGL
ncbi:MAG TPA: prepilin-type N-terminal cleavage/methylation domain-containing protein [Nitrospinota bacterium]|jgi:type IV pilus assembly protein PilW|nr:prepilin-type N-terminal cleavage/methylation domain-containing protein [Nitrospinota bacterium]